MVHETISEGKKHKPRGRPFAKGNKRGKLNDHVLDLERSKESHKGEIVTEDNQKSAENSESNILFQLPSKVMETCDKILMENLATSVAETFDNAQKENLSNDCKSLELMDCIDFFNGKNKISIKFLKRHNRMFRVQIFLNDKTELRPVTYTGASMGYAFWNLLKESLN